MNSIDHESFAFGIIAAPSSLHVDLARPFIEHETPVFIEKPLHHDLGPARRLAAEVDSVDVTTLVGCNMRFHPGLQTTRRLLRDQCVGDPLTATIVAGSYLPDWHPEEDYRQSYSARSDLGGGVTLDAVHEINYARWLFGEVTEVTAWIDHVSSLEIDTEDLAQLHLRFDSGVSAQLHLDYFHRPYRRGCHITTTDGCIDWDWSRESVRWYDATADRWAEESYAGWEVNQMYVDELAHFLDCVRGEATSICDVHEGLADLRVVEAAKESSETGRRITLA